MREQSISVRNLNGHIREISSGFWCLTRTVMTFAAVSMQVLHPSSPNVGWALLVEDSVGSQTSQPATTLREPGSLVNGQRSNFRHSAMFQSRHSGEDKLSKYA